ncbi:PD-(D/E)XK nuclease family protein [Xylophilus sp. GW821-FHT01B05]
MADIEKTHADEAGKGPATCPADALWLAPGSGVVARIAEALAAHAVHPAHAVVLLPYAQLMPVARHYWALARPEGFAPRFETTTNWARALDGGEAPEPGGITGDAARDVLQARALLEQVPTLRPYGDTLAEALMEAGAQLLRAMAAVPPEARAAWGETAAADVGLGTDAAVLQLEAATAHVALAWALASSCATDVLFGPQARAGGVRCLVVLDGLQPEPLVEALCTRWQQSGDPVVRIPLALLPQRAAPLRLHAAPDAEDEAERAAACVLARVREGAVPVALVAQDRALTRRIGAMLRAQGLALRDESGWKLSTTRAAAQVAASLRACARHATADEVLDWLKQAPSFQGGRLRALESALRREGVRDWIGWQAPPGDAPAAALLRAIADDITPLREAMQRARPLAQWLAALRALLQAGGQWTGLEADLAGQKLITVLRLDEAAQAAFAQSLEASPWAERRIGLAAFTSWARQALEAASFLPEARWQTTEAEVVVLPMAQLLARPFGAVVMPGCDELRLPAAPEPPGNWSATQRTALGLTTREAQQAATAAAWQEVLRAPQVDILWRSGDEGGEPLLPSPLVQALQAEPGATLAADDPRALRHVLCTPTAPPLPQGDALPVAQLSASAYEDLRKCPYRFFSLRQLGLKEADELDAEVDKRDFGLWLHETLKLFHEALAETPTDVAEERTSMLDAAAEAATRARRLAPEEFLPFAATWPQARDGYLAWLAEHEAGGARFAWAEAWREQPLGRVMLVGQIDRLDHTGHGEATTSLVLDYKTEGLQTTRERLKRPGEDTQLAFYAALLEDDALRAAYLNVGEKGPTTFVEQDDVVAARDLLVEGILEDLSRIAEGAGMPALGEGVVCEYCSARGLCRKDFWSVA